jgi:MHS family proline/betaine transporter-like MFS transporter
MSGATFLIGCLPSYAMVGLAAPVLLLVLRMIQGFSAAGEYAGAATFLAEYAPTSKRGLYCSLVPASTAVGLFVGSMLATIMTVCLPAEAVNIWGWRIPFLLAGPLGLIAHYIRTKLEDSPTYQQMRKDFAAKQDSAPHPIRDLFKNNLRELVISFGACVLNAMGFYIVLTYLPTYLSTVVGMNADESQIATTISLAAYIAFVFISGKISDRFGRKRMLITACVLFIVFTVPAFLLLNTGDFIIVLIVELVMCFVLTINDGTLSSYLTETFPTSVRYTGFALSFNLANAIFGGTASMIATWLVSATGNNIAPAWYMIAISVIALIAMILSHENSEKDLEHI